MVTSQHALLLSTYYFHLFMSGIHPRELRLIYTFLILDSSFHKHTKNNRTLYSIVQSCTTPLLSPRHYVYWLIDCDFITVYTKSSQLFFNWFFKNLFKIFATAYNDATDKKCSISENITQALTLQQQPPSVGGSH